MKSTCVLAICYCSAAFVIFEVLPLILPSLFITIYNKIGSRLLSFIIVYYCFPNVKKWALDERISSRSKAVLITGCDTGFGHALAKRMDSKGFYVFACCLFPHGDGAKTLKEACSNRLHIVGLDVGKGDSVQSALDYVQNNLNDSVLWAVVNNAGIFEGYDLSWTKLESFERTLNINSLGLVRVTKAFLPLLRKSKGRVVTITSTAGRITLPNMTPYVMSKFAATAFVESLRKEVEPWGINVIAIEPEAFNTMIADPKRLLGNLSMQMEGQDEKTMETYGENYFSDFKKTVLCMSSFTSNKIHKVIDCFDDAITLEHPNHTYIPARNMFFYCVIRFFQLTPISFQNTVSKIICRYYRITYRT